MIVYGDPAYSIPRAEARERLSPLLDHAASGNTDSARNLLIALGQIEQAIADSIDPQHPTLLAIMQATDRAAEFFVAKILGKQSSPETLRACQSSVAISLDGSGDLHIKIPEGFAFYSLFPEQYIDATQIWVGQAPRPSSPGAPAQTERTPAPISVIGIRSIGTTLSAVVRAALLAHGVHSERITVRPRGHPFNRIADLQSSFRASPVIIADEGPGLSGSSFVSVARALRQRGVTDITFFPSHNNPPGAAASEETKTIWSQIPSITSPLRNAPPESSPLIESLRQKTEQLLSSPIRRIHDLSAGRWLSHVHSTTPLHAAPQFERTKFRLIAENGRSTLWKFAGLGPGQRLDNLTASAFVRQNHLAQKGWTLPALAHTRGFIATEWVDAPRASSVHLSSHFPEIARYLAESSLPPLSEADCECAIHRLIEMLHCNFAEAGLAHLLSQVEKPYPNIARLSRLPASADGRLAPHEWLLHNDRLLKTDVWGHQCDHTIIGCQPILWDIAGAIIEWNIADFASFLRALHAERIHAHAEDLSFFLRAYTAFQIGLCTFANDPRAIAHYRAKAESLP